MRWFEAKKFIRGCLQSWQNLKQQFDGKEREILDKAYLVVDYSFGQIELSQFNLENIALNHPSLLLKTYTNMNFIRLVKKKVWLMNQIAKTQRNLEWIERQIKNVDIEQIELNPFTVEIRFKQLNFELIQRLKHSEYCDKTKTEMSRASIRIALKDKK